MLIQYFLNRKSWSTDSRIYQSEKLSRINDTDSRSYANSYRFKSKIESKIDIFIESLLDLNHWRSSSEAISSASAKMLIEKQKQKCQNVTGTDAE